MVKNNVTVANLTACENELNSFVNLALKIKTDVDTGNLTDLYLSIVALNELIAKVPVDCKPVINNTVSSPSAPA